MVAVRDSSGGMAVPPRQTSRKAWPDEFDDLDEVTVHGESLGGTVQIHSVSKTLDDSNAMQAQPDEEDYHDSIRQKVKQVRRERFTLRSWLFELVTFLIFLAAFTASTMMFKDRNQSHFLEALMRERIVPTTAIRTPDDFWGYVDSHVAPFLRGDNLTGHDGSIFGNLRVPTGVRLRQIRVPETTCARTSVRMQLSGIMPEQTCYGSLGLSSVEQSFLLEDGSEPKDIPAHVASAYTWSDEQMSDEIVQFGAMGLYPPNGFLIDNKNLSQLSATVATLKERKWIDLKTRVVFVDFELYSANLDIWLTSRSIFEWLPSGVVLRFPQVRAVYLDRYKFESTWDFIQLSLEGVCALMMAWHLINEMVAMVTLGVQKYIRSFWNMVELANLGFMGVTCFLRVKDSLKMQQLISDPSLVTSPKLQNLAFWVAQEDNCLSMAALIMWLKLLKFARLTKRLNRIMTTLERASPDMVALVFVFAVALVAFSITGVLIFGSDLPQFGGFLGALGAQYDAVFGSFDSQQLYTANRFVGHFFLGAWLVLSLVMCNLMISILSHHYAVVCHEEELGSAAGGSAGGTGGAMLARLGREFNSWQVPPQPHARPPKAGISLLAAGNDTAATVTTVTESLRQQAVERDARGSRVALPGALDTSAGDQHLLNDLTSDAWEHLGGGGVRGRGIGEDGRGNVEEMKAAVMQIMKTQDSLVSSLAQVSKTISELSSAGLVAGSGGLVPGGGEAGATLGPDATPSDWANLSSSMGFVSSTAGGSSLRAKAGLASLMADKAIVDDD